MNTLIIAPLATPSGITSASATAIRNADVLFLQTTLHPSAKWVSDEKIPFISMDDLYIAAEDFDELNLLIAERLLCSRDAVYAVPGRGIGDGLMQALQSKAAAFNTRIVRLPSPGYAEAALCALSSPPPCEDMRTITANMLPTSINPAVPLCIEEIDTQIRAGEVKLALLEYYDESFPISFCTMDSEGNYRVNSIELYMLDRQAKEDYFAASTLILRSADFAELKRYGMDELMYVLQRLRAPGGCPWDAEQTHASLKNALIEESYEVLDAIDAENPSMLCEELGDLLMQVAFHACIASATQDFTLRDITSGIAGKLIYRHPHVFGSAKIETTDELLVEWEKLKKTEKQQSSASDAIRAVPKGFPALMRAAKVQKRAADVGFDWDNAEEAFFKIAEESNELKAAIESNESDARIESELGDLVFSVVNVARLLKKDGELALQSATDRFAQRFALMEQKIQEDGLEIEKMSLKSMDYYWNFVKNVQNTKKTS